jgi:hypothetical protein
MSSAKCFVPNVLSRTSYPECPIPVFFSPSSFCHVLEVLSKLFFPSRAVKVSLSRLYCLQGSCLSCPDSAVLSQLSCLRCSASAVLSSLSCLSGPVSAVLSKLSCLRHPVSAVLAVLLLLSCPLCHVPTVLSSLSSPECPALAFTYLAELPRLFYKN